MSAETLESEGQVTGADPSETDNAEEMVKLLESRIGNELSDEDREVVRARLIDSRLRCERLRQFPLENGDEPAPGFNPCRMRESGR